MTSVSRHIVVTVLGLALGSSAVRAQELEWTVAPYLWAADVGLDLRLNGDPALGVDVPFSDLVDKLDSAIMLHAEGRGENFGAYVDFITLDLSDSSVTPIGPGGPILGDLAVDARLGMDVIEAGGILRFGGAGPDAPDVDVLFGLRYLDIDQDIDITLPGPGGTVVDRRIAVSELDVLIGARVIGKFSERWGYKLRGDYATFGTEGTVNLFATVGYTFGQGLFTLDAGYRYMSFEVRENLDLDASSRSDLDFSGPLVGLIFNF